MANKKVNRLMYLLQEKHGMNVVQKDIHGVWIQMGGKKAQEATEEDLNNKIVWLDSQIEEVQKGTWQGWFL